MGKYKSAREQRIDKMTVYADMMDSQGRLLQRIKNGVRTTYTYTGNSTVPATTTETPYVAPDGPQLAPGEWRKLT